MIQRLYTKAIFVLLLVALVPGYPRMLVLGNVINVQAWTSVLLLVLLLGHFVVRRGKSIYVIYLAALFLCGAMLGYVVTGDFGLVLAHAYSFLPFINAFLLLELNIGFSFRPVLLGLTVCAAVGVITANFIHWFRPETLGLLLKEEEDVSGVIKLGRVSWAGYVIALPLIAQLGFLSIYTRKQRFIVLFCVPIILVGAVLTFSRTTLIALVSLLCFVLYSRRREMGLKGVTLVGLMCLGGSAFISWWSQINPNLTNLINYRILHFFSGSSEISGDFSTRQILYSEYLDRLTHSYFLGQGLGVPMSTYFGATSWVDITLVSFAGPFGVFGVALFVVFLRRVYARINTHIDDQGVRRLLVLVLFLALAISLNDDIWSHKSFAVYFIYIINSYRGDVSAARAHMRPA